MVSVYQYMRLRGYPADKISILTTYNGQRALLSDVIEARCARHPAFGRPLKVCLSVSQLHQHQPCRADSEVQSPHPASHQNNTDKESWSRAVYQFVRKYR